MPNNFQRTTQSPRHDVSNLQNKHEVTTTMRQARDNATATMKRRCENVTGRPGTQLGWKSTMTMRGHVAGVADLLAPGSP